MLSKHLKKLFKQFLIKPDVTWNPSPQPLSRRRKARGEGFRNFHLTSVKLISMGCFLSNSAVFGVGVVGSTIYFRAVGYVFIRNVDGYFDEIVGYKMILALSKF